GGWVGKSPWFRAAHAHAGNTISMDGTVAAARRVGVRRRLGKPADCVLLTQRSSQTSSKRQPLYELFVMIVTPFTCGDQQVARRECKMIGRATSSCNFLSISQTSFLRFSRSVSADCWSNSFSSSLLQ